MQRGVPTADAFLRGELVIPATPVGVVVLAHDSECPQLRPAHQAMVDSLSASDIAALLLDLRTSDEVATCTRRCDVERLGRRAVAAIDWLDLHRELRGLPVGCFGAGLGAAAARMAAVERPHRVAAVLSCGGRPELAPEALRRVVPSVLLVVGTGDPIALEHLSDRSAAWFLRRLRNAFAMHGLPDPLGTNAREHDLRPAA